MSKRDINGRASSRVKVPTERYRRRRLEYTFEAIDREEREKLKEKKPGARELVLIAYKKRRSIDDAYLAIKVFNDKVGVEAYSKDVVERWISEYENTIKKDSFDGSR